MSFLTFAEEELNAIGYTPDCEVPNRWMRENVLELLKVFGEQGHSGSSAPHCIALFTKLADYKPLSPVTDDGWVEIGDSVLQHKRCSALFKEKGGKAYYIDAIIWRTPHSAYGGTAKLPKGDVVTSRQFVKFPFVPKTFYVDVDEVEIAPDDWEFTIKNASDLTEAFMYYDNDISLAEEL